MNYEAGRMVQERSAGPDGDRGTGAPRRRRLVIVAAAIAILAMALAAWAYRGGSGGAAPAAAGGNAEELAPVTVIVPGREPADRVLAANGTIAARRDLPVGIPGEGGLVTAVLVEPGQWVRKGQVLATVDRSVQVQNAAALGAQVSVARADLTLAQAELDRAQALVDRGFISKADLQRRAATRDAAAARLKVASASYGEARARNGRLDIRAPEPGLVLTRQIEEGQIVGPGSTMLFRIADRGMMELRAQLTEGDLQALRVGARAVVTPVGTDRSFPGQVWQISPVVDPSTRQGIARIAVGFDPALRPGGFANVRIVAGSTTQPTLPEAAVLNDAKGSFVYVVGKDDKVERRDVEVGGVSDAGVAIAEGLAGTERVVRSAGAFLSPGQKVKPVRQAAAKG